MPVFMVWQVSPVLPSPMLQPRSISHISSFGTKELIWFLQARFALSSSAVFSRTDLATDSERFYNTVLEFLYDVEEKEDVDSLLMWWNRWDLYFFYDFLTPMLIVLCSLPGKFFLATPLLALNLKRELLLRGWQSDDDGSGRRKGRKAGEYGTITKTPSLLFLLTYYFYYLICRRYSWGKAMHGTVFEEHRRYWCLVS